MFSGEVVALHARGFEFVAELEAERTKAGLPSRTLPVWAVTLGSVVVQKLTE